jgi:hypothetical protein
VEMGVSRTGGLSQRRKGARRNSGMRPKIEGHRSSPIQKMTFIGEKRITMRTSQQLPDVERGQELVAIRIIKIIINSTASAGHRPYNRFRRRIRVCLSRFSRSMFRSDHERRDANCQSPGCRHYCFKIRGRPRPVLRSSSLLSA